MRVVDLEKRFERRPSKCTIQKLKESIKAKQGCGNDFKLLENVSGTTACLKDSSVS